MESKQRPMAHPRIHRGEIKGAATFHLTTVRRNEESEIYE